MTYIRNNMQFLLLMTILIAVGIFFAVGSYVALLLLVYLMWRGGMFTEILLGFILVLVMSDNLIEQISFPIAKMNPMGFAKTLKYEYIILMFGIFVVDRERFRPFNKLVSAFAPFLFIALISFMSYPSEGPVSAFESIARWISYLLLFIVVPNYVQLAFRLEKEVFFKKLIYFLLMILATGYLLGFIESSHAYSHELRFRGWFGNPNGLGIFAMLVLILFVVTNAYFSKLFTRPEKILFYLFIGAIVLLTDSRNALVCSLLLITFANFSSISPFFGILIALVTAMVVPIAVANLASVVQSLGLQEYFRLETLEEGSGRYIAWNFAWLNIQDHLLLGRGFGYDLKLMRSNFDTLSRLGHEGGVHNTYLILWLNTGLFGLLAYFRAFFLQFIRAAKNTKLALPIMLAIMVSIIFEPWLAASLNPFTILFLIGVTVITEKEFLINESAEENLEVEAEELEGAPA